MLNFKKSHKQFILFDENWFLLNNSLTSEDMYVLIIV
jgi:hypothetical protein